MRLDDGDLGSHSALSAKMEILGEARLRYPVPEIAGSGKRRDANLRQRVGLSLGDQGFFQTHQEAAALPIDGERGGAEPDVLAYR